MGFLIEEAVSGLRVDMARVIARKDAIVAKSREGVESWMRGLKNTEVIVGDARFAGPATLEVGGRRLSAPRIFLNVGGRAAGAASSISALNVCLSLSASARAAAGRALISAR